MVGSDCRRMLALSRLTNTAATRSRSSLRPVSFSTIEASTMASSSDLKGRSFLRCAQAFGRLARFGLHAIEDRLALRAAIDHEGLGQQRSFRRHGRDLTGEVGVRLQPLDDLVAGEALREPSPCRTTVLPSESTSITWRMLAFCLMRVVAGLELDRLAALQPRRELRPQIAGDEQAGDR